MIYIFCPYRTALAQCASKGVGLSIAKSIRGHQLVWHVGVALPENGHVARCSRYCKLAQTDLNTFGDIRRRSKEMGIFPWLTTMFVTSLGGCERNEQRYGWARKRLIHPSPPRSTNYTLTGQMYCTAVTVGAHFGENAPVSLARSPFFTHTSLSFSVASQLWIGQLCWNMSLESRLLI